uniref:Rac GTPase-activating protein 1 n=1 Tax=Panagrolaimus davidi TaxID=227884 RepID=A0A914P4S2_9BILA
MQQPSKLCSTESESIGREFVASWSQYVSLLETSSEQDILNLLDLLESVRVKWQKSEAETNYYKEKLAKSEENNNELKSVNERLNGKLLHCQSSLNRVSKSKDAIEDELEQYKKQWEKLKSILKDSDEAFISDGLLAIINNVPKPIAKSSQNTTTRTQYRNEETEELSTFESAQSDIDYDKTGESLNPSPEDYPGPSSSSRPSRKRPSTSQTPKKQQQPLRSIIRFDDDEAVPIKKSRNHEDIEITATVRIDPNGTRKPSAAIKIRRSRSESDASQIQKEIINIKPQLLTPHFNNSLHFPLGFAGSWTRGQDIHRRQHFGELISFPISFSCDICNKRFGFSRNAFECRYCNLRFHQKCQPRAMLPCIPKVKIPKTPSKSNKNGLIDYCPNSHPFIPPLIIHCIVALEREHLCQNGIYRVSSSQTAVKELYQQFLCSSSRILPNLTNVPMEVITGCIKMFLRQLRDTVIPSTSYNDFLQAVEENDEQKLIQSIFELSAPNRDTLAYIIIHLQKVAENSAKTQMPAENLATVLAPTIIGHSNLEFWNRFIENNMSAVLAAEARTPGSRTALLSVTPTTQRKQPPTSTSSNSRNRTPKIPAISNNNRFRLESQSSNTNAAAENSSPLLQPLSMASKGMKGISFKPAF